jgi:hypothetical protein
MPARLINLVADVLPDETAEYIPERVNRQVPDADRFSVGIT